MAKVRRLSRHQVSAVAERKIKDKIISTTIDDLLQHLIVNSISARYKVGQDNFI